MIAFLDKLAFAAFRRVLTWLFRLYFGVRLIRRTPRDGAYIIAANHTSFLDAFLVGMVAPRRVRFLMTDMHANMPGARWLFRWTGVIFVKEGRNNREMLRQALKALAAGEVIGIFPEGMISTDGLLLDVQPGVVAIAQKSGVPIVPVGIAGAFRALPKEAWLPRPHAIRVAVGAPIDPADLVPHRSSRTDSLRVGATRLRSRIAELLPADQVEQTADAQPPSAPQH